METLKTFLNLEVNEIIKDRILKTIRSLEDGNEGSKVMTFNIYSLTIYPKRKEVLLSNDLTYEVPDELIPLDEFCKALEDVQKK